jgi:hypothetical protein
MDSPSRSRKRGSEDQLGKQIENSEPENTKRSKTSLECILEAVPTGDLNSTGKPPHLAVSSDDRALYVSDYNVDLREQPNMKRPMMNSQSRREGEELSGTIAHEPMVRQNAQTPVNGNTGQGPITNYHNTFAVPISTRQEDQGTGLARDPYRPAVRMNPNSLNNSGGVHQLERYQMQLILLEQDIALRKINSLPDQLNIAHTAVKELLEHLPAYLRIMETFKCFIPAGIEALQGFEEDPDNKEAKIKALENSYNELIQMTPEAQQGELRQVKDKAMLTMQQDLVNLRRYRDQTMVEVERRNERIAGLEEALGRAREVVPELIEDLIKLAPKLRDV